MQSQALEVRKKYFFDTHENSWELRMKRMNERLRFLQLEVLFGFLCLLLATCSPAVLENESSEPSGSIDIFRIDPILPVEELRALAREAKPPAEEGDFRTVDLVNLASLDPTLQFDIRYATSNNFMSEPFYRFPRAYLQRPAAESLLAVHRELGRRGLGLLIFDAYRPWFVTKMFWEGTPEEIRREGFVADPSRGSRHNRGAAVDLTLYRLETGEPLPMPSGYDEFTERARTDYEGGTAEERSNRVLLIEAMGRHGFTVLELEWWHYDFKGWQEYPILNQSFEELEATEPAAQ